MKIEKNKTSMKNSVDLINKNVSCKKTEMLINQYLDQDLDTFKETRLKRHLTNCPSCNQKFQEYLKLSLVAKELSEVPLPKGVSKRLFSRLSKKLNLNINCSNPSNSLYLVNFDKHDKI